MNRLLLLGASLVCLVLGCSPGPDSVVFLVRHAEKVDDSRDPDLTEEGRARARMLAALLQDAGIEAVYSTDFIRTRETARPVAEEMEAEIEIYDDLDELVARLEATPRTALIVGHSNTTPQVVALLGGEPGPPISDDEYDRLYLIVLSEGKASATTVLRLPDPSP
ncbi:MAG TPA: phosphoglycerate mutase family protein [Vicinamibacteria bacterium]|nr:phosphoglycerate mutase family protein [Vicinamibacteria bacterium]